MKEILQRQFLDNTLLVYIQVFGAILIALIIKRIISKYLAGLLYGLFAKTGKSFRKKAFLELIVTPLDHFLFLLVIIISFDKLNLPNVLDFTFYKITSRTMLDAAAHTALIITFIRFCIRFIKFVAIIFEEKANLTTDQSDNQLVVFFRDFFKVVLYIVGFLMLLRFTFNYDISKLVTGLSLVGAAVALATKESLENLIASFIIFFDKPFTTGDLVKVQGFTGVVERIGLRSTRMRTDHKTHITVPNKQMVDTILDNITLRTQRRAEVTLQISLATTAAQLKQAVTSIKNIVDKEGVQSSMVFLSDTGKDAHIITTEYFTSMAQTINQFVALREKINLAIIEMLEKNKIELAAANTDIVIKKGESQIIG